MKYFKIFRMGKPGRAAISTIKRTGPIDHFDMGTLLHGERIADWNAERLYAELRFPELICDFMSFGFHFADRWLISKRAAILIREHIGEDEVQLLPISIMKSDGSERRDGFFVPNWLHHPDCLIVPLSRLRRSSRAKPGDFLSLTETGPGGPFTFDLDKLGDRKIFRPQGSELTVFVREDIVKLFKKAKLTGFQVRSHKDFWVIATTREDLIREWRAEGRSENEIQSNLKECGLAPL